jgi:hypothetical protein
MELWKLVALQKEKHLMEHQPMQLSGVGREVAVIDFINLVEHFV